MAADPFSTPLPDASTQGPSDQQPICGRDAVTMQRNNSQELAVFSICEASGA